MPRHVAYMERSQLNQTNTVHGHGEDDLLPLLPGNGMDIEHERRVRARNGGTAGAMMGPNAVRAPEDRCCRPRHSSSVAGRTTELDDGRRRVARKASEYAILPPPTVPPLRPERVSRHSAGSARREHPSKETANRGRGSHRSSRHGVGLSGHGHRPPASGARGGGGRRRQADHRGAWARSACKLHFATGGAAGCPIRPVGASSIRTAPHPAPCRS
jgi:hypothetical protein